MRTVLRIVASLSVALAAVSCIYDYYPESVADAGQDAASDAGKVTLMMNVRTLGTRAGADYACPYEVPRYLRIVIVGTDYRVSEDLPPRSHTPWKVEVNYRISEDMAAGGNVLDAAGKQLKFPDIEADRKKRVYLFINCEDIRFTLPDGSTCGLSDPGAAETLFGAGTTPDPERGQADGSVEHPYQTGRLPIDECTYSLDDARQGLPYVGVYEIDVPSTAEVLAAMEQGAYDSQFIEPLYTVGPLYIVRAANRIRFRFVNDTAHADGPGDETAIDPINIDVLGWTLSSVADRSYIMPHLAGRTKSAGGGWDKDGWALGVIDGKPTALTIPQQYTFWDGNKSVSEDSWKYYGGEWVLWLKQEAERTQESAGSVDGTEPEPVYEWLTGYSLPVGAEHSPLTYTYAGHGMSVSLPAPVKGGDGKYGMTERMVPAEGSSENAAYFPESRYLPDGGDADQRYGLEVRVRQTNTSGDTSPQEQTYTCDELPNSLSLFRNTDLLVTVRFVKLRTDSLRMAVDVVPYGVAELEPVFGLDR